MVQNRNVISREPALSTTHRELIALVAVYSNEALLRQWEGQSISHLTDNMGVSAIMRIGSPVASLHEMAVFIHRHCRAHNLLLRVHWRPRADPRMAAADARSRHFDVDDWGIDYQGYQEVLSFSSSRPVVDLFATADNRKCSQFASKFAAEFGKAVGINAFSLNWKELGFFFACPPPKLTIAVLRQVAAQAAKGVLVVPCWPTSHYWPTLFPDGMHSSNMVVAFMRFRPKCTTGEDVSSNTFQGGPRFDLLACELSGACESPSLVNLDSNIFKH
jgi:hypothetical protein